MAIRCGRASFQRPKLQFAGIDQMEEIAQVELIHEIKAWSFGSTRCFLTVTDGGGELRLFEVAIAIEQRRFPTDVETARVAFALDEIPPLADENFFMAPWLRRQGSLATETHASKSAAGGC